jgi:sulfur transfer complex TusBCD TusB component (DsrH family)
VRRPTLVLHSPLLKPLASSQLTVHLQQQGTLQAIEKSRFCSSMRTSLAVFSIMHLDLIGLIELILTAGNNLQEKN